ncbi:MAG TPA: AsnC family transcriptional regulator [Candidatus Acidoferrum sp.]|nr:AsnC family transcriptional regulator [Candidatus Acidoferrum sp.]
MSREEKPLKGIELKLVSELMKNSKRSDREIAKAIGVSQPTISRTMVKLEKEGVLREYTVIPDFRKIGYNLAAITLGNVREDMRKPEKIDAARREFVKNFDDVTFEIVLDVRGMGMEHDGAIFSFHKNYSEYADFRRRLMAQPFVDPSSLESFIIDLNDKAHHRHFTLSYLAQHLLQTPNTRDET